MACKDQSRINCFNFKRRNLGSSDIHPNMTYLNQYVGRHNQINTSMYELNFQRHPFVYVSSHFSKEVGGKKQFILICHLTEDEWNMTIEGHRNMVVFLLLIPCQEFRV